VKPPKCRACGVEEWRHVCAPSFPAPSRATSKPKAEGVLKTAPRANAAPVSNVSNSDAERVRRWRAKGPNRDAYNAQQRATMRRVRAARRVSGAAT
jgi:hypothetical protein